MNWWLVFLDSKNGKDKPWLYCPAFGTSVPLGMQLDMFCVCYSQLIDWAITCSFTGKRYMTVQVQAYERKSIQLNTLGLYSVWQKKLMGHQAENQHKTAAHSLQHASCLVKRWQTQINVHQWQCVKSKSAQSNDSWKNSSEKSVAKFLILMSWRGSGFLWKFI